MKKTNRWLGTLISFFLVFGCARGISKQARSQVTYSGAFAVLQADPDKYMGETLLIGGKILDTRATTDSSEITVLQLGLSQQDRPEDEGTSEGRFLIYSNRFLDPAVYKKDTLLTVVGRLTGKAVRKIGELDYVYPRLEAMEIKLWSERQRGYPVFHFGIGIGTTF